MQNLFDPVDAAAMLERLERITPRSRAAWGQMNVAQMLAHCSKGLEMATGRLSTRQQLIGRILGPLFKSKFTNEKPFAKGSPTSPELVVADARDFETEKRRLRELIRFFTESRKVTDLPHPFFGTLTAEQWSRGMYKHLDHHFRQFNA